MGVVKQTLFPARRPCEGKSGHYHRGFIGFSQQRNLVFNTWQVVSAAFHTKTNMVVVGFSSGIFGLYSLPECSNLHTLSISSHRIQTVDINSSGEWLAFGSRALGQLLVWEWQSETCKSLLIKPVLILVSFISTLAVLLRHSEAARPFL